MTATNRQGQIGMVLIEAMVALVVLAVGAIGVSKLNTYFIEVSGQAKARAQAAQLAESKLAELRSLMVQAQFDSGIANGSEEVFGHSKYDVVATEFQRAWAVVANGDEGKEVTVTVSWTDRFGKPQQVAVSSVIAWNNPGSALALVEGTKEIGRYATTPTGRAVIPHNERADIPDSDPEGDGIHVLQGEDRKWRIADLSGKVLLMATRENEEFSQIAGRVYFDQTAGTGSNRISLIGNLDVYVVISDASYCSMLPAKTQGSTLANLGDGAILKYFDYRCYVGANWYGNIGVVRNTGADVRNRVCVGDPAVAEVAATAKSDNRHPALSTARMYRGYLGGNGNSIGIGVRGDTYTPAIYDGHDFLFTVASSGPDCATALRRYDSRTGGDGAAPWEPFGTDAQNHRPVTETAYLYGDAPPDDPIVLGNPGRFFCFTASCTGGEGEGEPPAPLQTTIEVSGIVARSPYRVNDDPPSILAMVMSTGADCSLRPVWGNNQEESSQYECAFTGDGFTGTSWSGSITVETSAGARVCESSSIASVSGTGPFVISFTDLPTDNTLVSLNFAITTALTCP